jgi:hypothetical protein
MPRLRPSALCPALAGVALLFGSGCVPYAVGTTAATLAPRETMPSAVVQIASANRALAEGDLVTGPVAAVGNEVRLGLDSRSDAGVRVMGALGSVVASYKRRLTGEGDEGTAVILGVGVVGTSRFHGEATLLRSWSARGQVVPYGGMRVQAMRSFSGDALDVPPAVGVFGGGRLGWPDLSISPEIGLFYSPSPLVGDGALVVVPSVTVTGERLMRALGL